MSDKMELKIHKILSDIRDGMLRKVIFESRNRVEYCQDKPEEFVKWMEYFANPDKWDHCGLLSSEDKKVLETLEYLLDDNMVEIRRYKKWKPMER